MTESSLRNARRFVGAGSALVLLLASPRGSLCQTPAPDRPVASPSDGATSFGATAGTASLIGGPGPPDPPALQFRDYFRALGHSFTTGLFAREQVRPLAIGGVSTLALLPFDEDISAAMRGDADWLGTAGDRGASPAVVAALSGGLLAGSLFSDNARFRNYAVALSQGLVVSATLTSITKVAVGRTRPDGSDDRSFPSGHAATSFVLAAVTSHAYGWKVGVPLYALAGLVAISRVEYGKHYPSDVVFGATLGYMSAQSAIRSVARVARSREAARTHAFMSGTLVPVFTRRSAGICYCVSF